MEKHKNGWNSNGKGWHSTINDKRSFVSGLLIGFAIGIFLGALL
ncbi:hypothetical protein Sps_04665 [Shewanella psychrophila]|uniref:Uncharacterized protein n=1 Tax=Shewanella psychrophila TaxID=225848 RepID=A0A1S6HWF6_9GAMM|nr:hypothetical protein [Shewanella psychrophila]AQS39748.1 hypothetical protein Sps_04665 [Shewanella psychrophila]